MREVNNFVANMPEMKSGNELIEAMSVLPEYDSSIRNANQAIRLMTLSDIYRLYLPSSMSIDIYTKLYLALFRSIQKKGTQLAIEQRNENNRAIQQLQYRGIIGGSDSFTIIGTSGIGKSSAIMRAIDLITENRVIEVEKPYTKIIPCLIVQCPFDSSVKGLLLEILRKVDEVLQSDYYQKAIKSRTVTIDVLIGSVSTIALNHMGILVIDEIQNVANSKNGKNLVGMLTQLINNSGISICMVGTPESSVFFESAMQLARRSVGLQYTTMNYDDYFENFCKVLWKYQYVKNKTEISPSIMEWLFEHSAGVVSVVVSLIHDAQEIAILSGVEVLNIETLNQAYQQRLSLLHEYIQPNITHGEQTSRKKNITVTRKKTAASIKDNQVIEKKSSLKELVEQAKSNNLDIVSLMKDNYTVVEVAV